MNREQKIGRLLLWQGVEERRRLALDELDATARQTSTWGSKEHRAGRDQTERLYESNLHAFDSSSDDEIDRALQAIAGE